LGSGRPRPRLPVSTPGAASSGHRLPNHAKDRLTVSLTMAFGCIPIVHRPTCAFGAPVCPTSTENQLSSTRDLTTSPAWTRRSGMLHAGRSASRSSHRWSSCLLATRGPGRGRCRPTKARPQLLGQHLDHGSGSAVLSGPCPLLEPAHDDHPHAHPRRGPDPGPGGRLDTMTVRAATVAVTPWSST
jgi:hypothetical protein